MKIKVKYHVRTGKIGGDVVEEVEVEVPNDASPEEIEAELEEYGEDWLWRKIEWGWERIE